MAEKDIAQGEAAELDAIAARHGVSVGAVRHLREALLRGHGAMAQFDHPDLGGFGQWSSGGMIMVGRMFDDALKAKVGALCTELARLKPPPETSRTSSGGWWPSDLGRPATAGSQNGSRYAFFPEKRRLAVETGGRLALYDTADHDIGGVSQQQGGADSALRFTGRGGDVDVGKLERIEDGRAEPAPSGASPNGPKAEPNRPEPSAASDGGTGSPDALATLERLAHLHRQGVLTDAEFADKKADLLRRV